MHPHPGLWKQSLEWRQGTALPASSSSFPLCHRQKANPARTGSQLCIGLGSQTAQAPQTMAWDEPWPRSTPPKAAVSLFILIHEQIPPGRVPGRAWVSIGSDLQQQGVTATEVPLLTASSRTAPCSQPAPSHGQAAAARQLAMLGRSAAFQESESPLKTVGEAVVNERKNGKATGNKTEQTEDMCWQCVKHQPKYSGPDKPACLGPHIRSHRCSRSEAPAATSRAGCAAHVRTQAAAPLPLARARRACTLRHAGSGGKAMLVKFSPQLPCYRDLASTQM